MLQMYLVTQLKRYKNKIDYLTDFLVFINTYEDEKNTKP